jgi:hypothetical protein
MRPDAGLVARTSEDLDHVNTLVPSRLEDRLIVFAQGVEFDDSYLEGQGLGWYTVETYLRDKGLDIEFSGGEAEYISHVQGVRFTVRITTDKSAYKRALETERAHVIYCGHARYGRGPCFGTDPGPGEHWGNGDASTGMFRMGYPYIAMPVSEILQNRYTTDPVPTDEPLEADDCHPYVRRVLSYWRPYTLEELDSSGQLRNQVEGEVSSDQTFWGYQGALHGHAGPHVVLHAGWENTATDPLDLGATELRCRVFCHFGCSTLTHNREILRERKGWQQTEEDRFAYFTTSPDAVIIPGGRFWLYRILSYPVYNAFEPWNGSLQYALRKANQDMRRMGGAVRFV